MSHLVTLLKKKKSHGTIYTCRDMWPQANSLSWLRCCQTPLGRGFETCVDVRAKLGDALCNLVVLPTPWNGYWWGALFLQWSLPSTSGKRQTDLIHHRLGTPYRWVSGKKILSHRPYGYWLVLWFIQGYKDGWGNIFVKKNF